MEVVQEMVKGEKKTSKRKFFPGYILVNMEMNDSHLAPRQGDAQGDRLRRLGQEPQGRALPSPTPRSRA